jgi:hypothetical protein
VRPGLAGAEVNMRALISLVLLAACAETRPPTPPPPADSVTAGKCFAKVGAGCQSDSGCHPPFATCQQGTCCSGELDPETCRCRCAGGPGCGPGFWCCAGHPNHVPPVEKVGTVMCRPETDCLDNGP